MAEKKEAKFMDVRKAKATPTSRPVIVGHGSMVKDPTLVDQTVKPKETTPVPGESHATAPPISNKKKRIMPISVGGEDASADGDAVNVVSKDVTEKTDEAVADEAVEAGDETTEASEGSDATAVPEEAESEFLISSTDDAADGEKAKPAETSAAKDGEKVEEKAEPAADEEAEDAKDEPAEETADEDKPPEQSGNAAVNTIVQQAEAKKTADKEAEAEALRQAEVEKAIATKKYFVPIGHDSTKQGGSSKTLIVLLVIILLAAGAYLALDAGVVKLDGLEVPYHIIGNK